MNLLNQKLASVRVQIKAYEKQARETTDQQELWNLSKKIEELHKEESFLLKELKVMD